MNQRTYRNHLRAVRRLMHLLGGRYGLVTRQMYGQIIADADRALKALGLGDGVKGAKCKNGREAEQ
ncbi:MAG: hypothetical protein LBQ10_12110 [Desulfovibrio sp.]|nr:hypothetical protein [Desulfovibrio sp.]